MRISPRAWRQSDTNGIEWGGHTRIHPPYLFTTTIIYLSIIINILLSQHAEFKWACCSLCTGPLMDTGRGCICLLFIIPSGSFCFLFCVCVCVCWMNEWMKPRGWIRVRIWGWMLLDLDGWNANMPVPPPLSCTSLVHMLLNFPVYSLHSHWRCWLIHASKNCI